MMIKSFFIDLRPLFACSILLHRAILCTNNEMVDRIIILLDGDIAFVDKQIESATTGLGIHLMGGRSGVSVTSGSLALAFVRH